MTFTTLGLSEPILKAVEDKGYITPSEIQAQAIPLVLQGKDLMGAAQTGTGKTASFTLPILEILSHGERVRSNQVRTLILTPTRELAAQVAENVRNYSQHLPLTSGAIFGGVKINPQMMRLRKGLDILVATPGRLLDLYKQNAVRFDQLEILVLDEADHMLDMGFIHDMRRIVKLLPKKRQNLMFSATFSDEIRTLAKSFLNNPVEISVSAPNTTVESVKQLVYTVEKSKKAALLTKLIHENSWKQVLVFSKTKHGANRLTRYLNESGLNIRASAIHGNKTQSARVTALAAFKKGEVHVLVATDIASRGIDIRQLPHVVNYDLPHVPEDYVHRIGRTGRAGEKGEAISLVSSEEMKLLKAIERLTKQKLPKKPMNDFQPVPDSERTQVKPFKVESFDDEKKPFKKKTSYRGKSRQDSRPSSSSYKGRSSSNKSSFKKAGAHSGSSGENQTQGQKKRFR